MNLVPDPDSRFDEVLYDTLDKQINFSINNRHEEQNRIISNNHQNL